MVAIDKNDPGVGDAEAAHGDRRRTAQDPLAVRSGELGALLDALNDTELEQFVAFWEARRETDRNNPTRDEYASWWAAKLIVAGRREQTARTTGQATHK